MCLEQIYSMSTFEQKNIYFTDLWARTQSKTVAASAQLNAHAIKLFGSS